MKIKDVERINELLKAREAVLELIGRVKAVEPSSFSLMIERGGDGSIKLSEEGADSAHYNGYPVSPGFLAQLKVLSLRELGARRTAVDEQLTALGVETEG